MTQLPKRLFRTLLLATALAILAHSSSAQAPGDRLQRVVAALCRCPDVHGKCAGAENGKIIFSKGYGMADLEWERSKFSYNSIQYRIDDEAIHRCFHIVLEDREIKDRRFSEEIPP